jgi:hypothetical protein
MMQETETSAAEAFSRPFDMSTLNAEPGTSPDSKSVDEPSKAPDEAVSEAAASEEPSETPRVAPAEGAPKPTFWQQTPEEKREQRFNDTLAHSQRQAKELEEYRAKVAKYESGEGPKPTAPAAEKSQKQWLDEALGSKEEGLSNYQREVRAIATELVSIEQQKVVPARNSVVEAEKIVNGLSEKIQNKRIVLADLTDRNKERAGLYDSEIQETERQLERLELEYLRADNALIKADTRHRTELDSYRMKQATARNRVTVLADESGRITREAASQQEEAAWLSSEQGKLNTAWEKAINEAKTELGLSPEIHEAAEDRAFLFVQRLDQARAAKGEPPIETSKFKELILESLQGIAKLHGTASGRTEARLAETRAAATGQPTPRNRVAKGDRDANQPTVAEAADELRRTLRASSLRRTPAA